MADKKTAKKTANDAEREGDQTYRALLKVENTVLATITIRAQDDDDAREQLKRAQPPAFQGIGKWELTKQETKTVEV